MLAASHNFNIYMVLAKLIEIQK